MVELIADEYNLQKQPHIISFAMLFLRNDDQHGDFFENRTIVGNMCEKTISTKNSGYPSLKYKNIVDLVKTAYETRCIITTAP